jgi:hypothetical protein
MGAILWYFRKGSFFFSFSNQLTKPDVMAMLKLSLSLELTLAQ